MKISMRRIFLLLMALFLTKGMQAQHQPESPYGIKFLEGSWQDAFNAAKTQHKYLFIDCYTTWCGPCKKMSQQIFPKKNVGDFYNKHFIAYKLDMEKGDGPAIAKKYGIQYYPTFLYFTPEGKLVHEAVGGRSGMEFIAVGQDATDSNHCVFNLLARFNKGKYTEATLKELLPKLVYVNDTANQRVLAAYWQTQIPYYKLSSVENWEIFKNYEKDISSPQFQYVSNNKSLFTSHFGTDVVNKVLMGKVAEAMDKAAEEGDSTTFKTAYNILSKSNDPDVLRYAAYSEAMYYKQLNKWDTFAHKADEYAAKYGDDASGLNELAWAAFKGAKDVQILSKATKWAKKSVDAQKDYANMDTYANLLFVTGQLKQAEAIAEEAIGLGKAADEPVGATQQLLDKIKAAKN